MSPTDAGKLEGALLELVRSVSVEARPDLAEREISLGMSLERDLGLDSIARAELLHRIETRLGVEMPDRLLATADTPGDLLGEIRAGGAAERAGPVTFAPAPPAAGPASPVAVARPGGVPRPDGVPSAAATLVEAFEWHVGAHPDRVHLVSIDEGGRPLTFGELMREGRAIAQALWEIGLRPGQTVALMLPTGRDYFRVFLGIWFAGCIPVPLYPASRPGGLEAHLRRQAGILRNAGASLLVADSGTAALAGVLEAAVPQALRVVAPDRLSGKAPAREIALPRPDDIALLQYTSGSTGNPKGVVLTHAHLIANVRAMGEAVRASPDDSFVSWLPLYHDMGLIGAWFTSLYFGIRLAVMSPLSFLARPVRWLRAISEHRATLSVAPNFGYELCLSRITDDDLASLDLSSWRMALNGAEPVSADTIARFSERFSRAGFVREAMTPVYGLAEAAVGLAFPPTGRGPVVDRIRREPFARAGKAEPVAPSDPGGMTFVSCGKALPGYRIRIVGAAGHEAGEREVGRIEFQGPSATSGYYRNPEESGKLFHDGWVDTGDLGYFASGELYLTGRVKDIIIKAGRNIVPQELEEATGALPDVRKGCVAAFASPDPGTGTERAILMAETRQTEPRRLRLLRDQIFRLAVDLLGVPLDDAVLVPPRTIPKTSSGKIRRSACRDIYEQGRFGLAMTGRGGEGPARTWIRAPLAGMEAALRLRVASLVAAAAVVRAVRGVARRAADLAYAVYAWTVFALLAAPAWLAQWVLPGVSRRRGFAGAVMRTFCRLAGIRVRPIGLERAAASGPCVVAANHFSYLDGPLLAAWLGPGVDVVATGQLLRERFKRPVLQRLGVRFVDPADPISGVRSIEDLSREVAAGRSLAVFPEGNLAARPGLRPFHMGAFVMAARAGVPVVPIAIVGTRSVLRPYSWWPRPGDIALVALDPVWPDGEDWTAAIRLRDRVRAAILPHCGEPAVGAAGARE